MFGRIKKRFAYIFKRHFWLDISMGNFKKPWHFLRVFIKSRLFHTPRVAMIETCNFCNLKCATCTTPHDKIKRERRMMSLDEYKKIIDNIKDTVHHVLLFFANEPLLHPQVSEMINYAHKNNLYTMISTNAVLLDEKMAKKLYEAKLDEILLCLDGLTKESYEPFRTGADFGTVFGNIKRFCLMKKELGAKKPYLELQFILTKLNQGEVEDVKKLAREWGVDRLRIKSFALSEYAYSKEEIKTLSEKFFPTEEKYKAKIRYEKEGGELQQKDAREDCKFVDSDIVILADGRVSMCCYDINGDYTYGSVLSKKLDVLWWEPEVVRKRKLARERNYPLCKVCAA